MIRRLNQIAEFEEVTYSLACKFFIFLLMIMNLIEDVKTLSIKAEKRKIEAALKNVQDGPGGTWWPE